MRFDWVSYSQYAICGGEGSCPGGSKSHYCVSYPELWHGSRGDEISIMKKNGGTFCCGKIATDCSCVSSSVVFRIAEAILPHLVSFTAYTRYLLWRLPAWLQCQRSCRYNKDISQNHHRLFFRSFFTSIEIRDFDLKAKYQLFT